MQTRTNTQRLLAVRANGLTRICGHKEVGLLDVVLSQTLVHLQKIYVHQVGIYVLGQEWRQNLTPRLQQQNVKPLEMESTLQPQAIVHPRPVAIIPNLIHAGQQDGVLNRFVAGQDVVMVHAREVFGKVAPLSFRVRNMDVPIQAPLIGLRLPESCAVRINIPISVVIRQQKQYYLFGMEVF